MDRILSGSGATIGGSIASTQIPYGTAANTIAGDSTLTFATGDKTVSVRYIQLPTAVANPSLSEGKFFYDNTQKAVGYYNDIVQVHVGQEEVVPVRNSTGSTIAAGKAVYVSGALGSHALITLATNATSVGYFTIGLTSASINNNADGYVVTSGICHGVDTSAWVDGDQLWLTTAGGLTNSQPASPNRQIRVGTVIYSHAVNGKIHVNVTSLPALDIISDVTLTAPASGEYLKYNGTVWVNATAPGGIADPGSNGILARTALNTTAARTITGDSSITVADGNGVSANPTLSRAALTGDVTASAGSNATTIANKAVTLAKMDDVATASVFYRKTAGTGVPEVQTLATLKTDLGLSGTNTGDQTLTFWSKIQNTSTVAITAATSATINRLHVVSGTSADYDITISGLSPSTGDVLGFYVKDYSAASKQFRLDAGGTVKIAGRTRYLTLLHTNVVLLMWDGTDWQPLVLNLDTPWITISNFLVSTSTLTAVTTDPTLGTNAINNCHWRRVGDHLHAKYVFSQTGAGTAGSGDYLYSIPIGTFSSNVEVDTSALSIYNTVRYLTNGFNGAASVGGTSIYYLGCVPYNTTKFRTHTLISTGGSAGMISSSLIALSNATVRWQFNLQTQMTDW